MIVISGVVRDGGGGGARVRNPPANLSILVHGLFIVCNSECTVHITFCKYCNRGESYNYDTASPTPRWKSTPRRHEPCASLILHIILNGWFDKPVLSYCPEWLSVWMGTEGWTGVIDARLTSFQTGIFFYGRLPSAELVCGPRPRQSKGRECTKREAQTHTPMHVRMHTHAKHMHVHMDAHVNTPMFTVLYFVQLIVVMHCFRSMSRIIIIHQIRWKCLTIFDMPTW